MYKLTQTTLKSDLYYNPSSGNFIRDGYIVGCKSRGYIAIVVKGKLYLAHRLAFLYMIGQWPTDYVDHINRNKSDNRWINLRDVTHKENSKNVGVRSDNLLGLTGISKTVSGYRVRISGRYLGHYSNLDEAKSVRRSAAIKEGYIL